MRDPTMTRIYWSDTSSTNKQKSGFFKKKKKKHQIRNT